MKLQRPPGGNAGLRLELREQLALGLGPDPWHLAQPALPGGRAQLLEVAHSEDAADLEHPLDGDAEEPSQPCELGRDVALELAQLGDLRRSRPAPAAAARCRGRCLASSRTRPACTSSATGAGVERISSAARR